MEDDIDIEEHDVLDNPRIRTIFPDLTQIKAEIPDDGYHDPVGEMEYQPYSDTEDHHHANDDHSRHQNDDDSSEYSRCGSRIILGSKPVTHQTHVDIRSDESALIFGRKPIEIKKEIEEHEENEEASEQIHDNFQEEQYDSVSTVLILGSKPSDTGVIKPFTANDVSRENIRDVSITTFFGEEIDLNCENNDDDAENIDNVPKDPTTAYVLVENWGSRLESSSCFCKECKILFPTSNTLLAHNMTAHSFLVAVDKNKAIKSTAKPAADKVLQETGKFCNHCNKTFPDSDSLINHLYKKLTFDKANAVFKYQPKKIDPDSGSDLKSDPQYSQEKLFRCEICSYYFLRDNILARHMKLNHAKSVFRSNKGYFNGTCVHCGTVTAHRKNYNKHIGRSHVDLLNQKKPTKTDLLKPVPKAPKSVTKHPTPLKVTAYSIYNAHKFKCLKCNEILFTYEKAKAHKQLKHAGIKSKGMFKKLSKIPLSKIQTSTNKLHSSENTLKQNVISTQKGIHPNHQKYQCQKCSEILPNYSQARKHRNLRHSECKTLNIFKKITSFGNKISVCVQKSRVINKIVLKYPKKTERGDPSKLPDVSPSTSKSPLKTKPVTGTKLTKQIAVPKSVIFRCDKCRIHFTSCTATVLHSEYCKNQIGEWKCSICKREFRQPDVEIHKMQHKLSDKLSVIVCNDNTYGRVLNQCPNCKFYFHEKYFYSHQRNDSCKGAGFKCGKCSISIHASSVEDHAKWHKRIESTKKNMILVEFMHVAISVGGTKKTLDLNDYEPPPKRAKIAGFNPHIPVHYCPTCNIYMFASARIAKHVSGDCKGNVVKVCKICGLTYTNGNHCAYHKFHPEVSLMDLKFINIMDNTVIAPPIPKYPKCNKCKVHFCRKATVTMHSCKESYNTCRHCLMRFSDLAFKLHMHFHEYHAKFKKTKPLCSKLDQNILLKYPTLPEKSKVKDPLPELLKKYEMLTDTWSILFACETCDILHDNYDKVVEHCQNHFNNMESYDVVIKNCETCDLNFDGSCFERHTELHAQNEKINKETFTILKYDYLSLFKKKWTIQFGSLPVTQLDQIMSRSIYKHGRSVKLRVVQEGAPEATLYRCEKCETFISPLTLTSHYKNVSCHKNTLKHCCTYCGIPFSSYKEKRNHENSHSAIDSFRIVYFNEEGDEEFNHKLREKSDVIKSFSNGLGRAKAYLYYRCEDCKCCVGSIEKARSHKCPSVAYIERCNICNLNFHRVVISKHMKLHEFNTRFIRKNMKVTEFKRHGSNEGFKIVTRTEEAVVRLFKCQCGLHFTSNMAIEKHFESGTDSQDIATEKCSKCNRLFDTTQLVTHLCKHHSKKETNTEFQIVVLSGDCKRNPQDILPITQGMTEKSDTVYDTQKINDLFKCFKCDVHYLSPKSLRYHCDTNHQVAKVLSCPFCKLKFMPMTLRKHIKLQHKILKYNVNDFNIHAVTVTKTGTLIIRPVKLATQVNQKPAIKHAVKDIRVDNANRAGCNSTIVGTFPEVDLKRYDNKLYKCKICCIHFLTASTLASHKSLTKDDNKHRSKMLVCPDCGYTFGTGSLLKHRYIHHENMHLNRKDLKIKYVQDKDDLSSDTEFATEDSQNLPKDTENFASGKKNIISARDSSSLKETESTVEEETFNNDGYQKTFKYSSVMYECSICAVIYFAVPSMRSHMRTHLSNKKRSLSLETCFCGLSFFGRSLSRHQQLHHEEQHLTRDDLYIIKMEMHEDVVGSNHLFRCHKCNLNFCNFYSLQDHVPNIEHNIGLGRECSRCGIKFMGAAVDHHLKLHHDIMNLNPEDLIVVQTIGDKKVRILDTSDDNIEKTTTSDGKNTGQKLNTSAEINNFNSKTTLHKCDVCGTNFLDAFTLNTHQDLCQKECKQNETEICIKCNLKFSKHDLETHVDMHHKSRDLKREDFQIIQFNTEKDAELKKKCVLNTLTKTVDDSSDNISDVIDTSIESVVNLSNKSNQLVWPKSETYRNLYKCNICARHYMHSSTLRSHLEYKPKKSVLPGKVTCTICGLDFSEQTLAKHMYVQHETHKLNTNDFRIITHEEIGLAKFSCKSEDGDRVIVGDNTEEKTSVTGSKHKNINANIDNESGIPVRKRRRSVFNDCYDIQASNTSRKYDTVDDSIEITKAQNPETSTKHSDTNIDGKDDIPESNSKRTAPIENERILYYRCMKCERCLVNPESMRVHYSKCQKSYLIKCDQCQLKFDRSFSAHMDLHKIGIELENIIVINYAGSRMSILTAFLKSVTQSSEDVAVDSKVYELSSKNKLFKCNTCSLHFVEKEMLDLHTWNPQLMIQKATCTYCGFAFPVNTLRLHEYNHHQELGLAVNDFIIKSKNENVRKGNEPLDDTSIMQSENDVETNSNDIAAIESTTKATASDSDHMQFEDNTTSPVNRGATPTFENAGVVRTFRCYGRQTVTSADSLDRSKCELQHSEPIIKAESDVPIPGSSNIDSEKKSDNASTIKLYKCSVCNVCFLSQSSCYKHTLKHVALDPKDYIECKLCGYQFLILSNCLHKHIIKHHQRPFKPEDVLIEEYHPDVLSHGTPKIEIYFGIDKVQSKLISTTSDANISSSDDSIEECIISDSSSLDLNSESLVNAAADDTDTVVEILD